MVTLTANVVAPVADTIVLDIPPGSQTLAVSQHSSKAVHAIFLHNTSSHWIFGQSMAINDPDGIAYFGSPGNTLLNFSDTLSTGKTDGPYLLTVEVNDTMPHSFSLVLNYLSFLQSITYNIVAKQTAPLADVHTAGISHADDFSVSPNPARDEVTIGLTESGISTVEIYDLLGTMMLRKEAIGEIKWSPKEGSGSYIVRVTASTPEGTVVTRSKRLVFVR